MKPMTTRLISSSLMLLTLTLLATPASAYDMFEMTSKGRGNIGINTSVSLTQSINELESGEQAKNTTFFLLATPKFGYFVSERLEFSTQAGVLMRRLQRDEDSGTTESAALINVGVNYHIPLNANLSLIPGLGLGGYFGRSSRPLLVDDDMDASTPSKLVDETTRSRGLDLFSQFSIGYRATDKAQIQAGLGFHYLYGGEFSDSTENLRVSTLNTSLLVGAMYFF
jgi:hypothetical protein